MRCILYWQFGQTSVFTLASDTSRGNQRVPCLHAGAPEHETKKVSAFVLFKKQSFPHLGHVQTGLLEPAMPLAKGHFAVHAKQGFRS